MMCLSMHAFPFFNTAIIYILHVVSYSQPFSAARNLDIIFIIKIFCVVFNVQNNVVVIIQENANCIYTNLHCLQVRAQLSPLDSSQVHSFGHPADASSSAPSQQSQTPSLTRLDGNVEDSIAPSAAAGKSKGQRNTPRGEHALVRGSSDPSAQSQ